MEWRTFNTKVAEMVRQERQTSRGIRSEVPARNYKHPVINEDLVNPDYHKLIPQS